MAGQIVNVDTADLISETALKCGDALFHDFPKNIYSQAVYRAERAIAKRYGILDRTYTFTNTVGANNGDGSYSADITPLNFDGAWRVTVQRVGDPVDLNYATLGGTSSVTGSPTVYILDYLQVQPEQVVRKLMTLPTTTIYPEYGLPYASAAPFGIPFDGTLPPYRYAINYQANRYVLTYSDPAINDIITMYYTSSIAGEEDFEPYDSQGNPQIIPLLPNKYYEEILRRSILYIAEIGSVKFLGVKGQQYQMIIKLYRRVEDAEEERGLEKDRPFMQIKAYSLNFPGD